MKDIHLKIIRNGAKGSRETIERLGSQVEFLTKKSFLNDTENILLKKKISEAERILNSISSLILNKISIVEKISSQIIEYVKENKKISDSSKYTVSFIKWAESQMNKKILSAKRQDTKINRYREKSELIRFYRKNQTTLKHIFDFMNIIMEVEKQITQRIQSQE